MSGEAEYSGKRKLGALVNGDFFTIEWSLGSVWNAHCQYIAINEFDDD